jgi:Ice-binding-like
MSTTQALDTGSITAINGTYGSGCLERSGSWSVLVSGSGGLTNAALTVVKNNTACILTLTSIAAAGQTYTAVSSIAMTDTYSSASAFGAGDAGAVQFYANAKLSSISFAGDFIVNVLVSGDPTAAMSTVTGTVLGAASSFAVLAGTSIADTGTTTIDNNIGVSPGATPGTDISSSLSGQPSPTGMQYDGSGTLAGQAQTDLTSATSALHGMSCPADHNLAIELGGLTLTPGVYCFGSTAALTGTLTLDAGGDPAAFWVFQIGTAITVAANANVLLINGLMNGGSACKVYWLIGTVATLGADDSFLGNIMAGTDITLGAGTTLLPGRVLAQAGMVTLDTNTISAAACQ